MKCPNSDVIHAFGINDADEIVGTCFQGSLNIGFVLSAADIAPKFSFIVPPGGIQGGEFLNDINNNGDLVGLTQGVGGAGPSDTAFLTKRSNFYRRRHSGFSSRPQLVPEFNQISDKAG
jgi:hypothetical protein